LTPVKRLGGGKEQEKKGEQRERFAKKTNMAVGVQWADAHKGLRTPVNGGGAERESSVRHPWGEGVQLESASAPKK